MALTVTGVQVFDGNDFLSQQQRVHAEGDKLTSREVEGVTTFDFSSISDATLLPGLIDAHLHLAISGADQSEKADPGPLVALRMVHNGLANLRAGVYHGPRHGCQRTY